jgi:hypothetical protein
MTTPNSPESDLPTPLATDPVNLLVRGALSALSCGAALDRKDHPRATNHLGDLRALLARLERDGRPDRSGIVLLRSQEERLSKRLFCGEVAVEPEEHGDAPE